MKRIVWWLRRDFRLMDNHALTAALADGAEVLPVFILDESLLRSERVQGYRLGWMVAALHALNADLEQHGARLIVRRGAVAAQLVRLCREAGAEAVYFNRDYSPYAQRRDDAVREAMRVEGIAVKSFKDLVIHETDEVRSGTGKQYEVYSPYRRAWESLPKPAPLPHPGADAFKRLVAPVPSEPLPLIADYPAAPAPIAPPGEAAALTRLDHFLEALIYRYAEDRNTPSIDGTSILSPYLRWGMISPRTCYAAAMRASAATHDPQQRENVASWIGELVWREFNYQILENHPHIVTRSFRKVYDNIDWEEAPALVAAWQAGRTGYPIVDAAMRQLNATGWMHNRTRMIVASFLVKDCLIDWRVGERYFMQRLLDGEVANNVGNWQWVAGTGTDAAPYFRIFNPTAQGEKFDPTGAYVRRWVPELSAVPDKHIHQPSRLSLLEQDRYGCHIGKEYPAPVVDHSQQRERALALYETARLLGGKA
jgi:deoxyribodipyrimidine photo-lyase